MTYFVAKQSHSEEQQENTAKLSRKPYETPDVHGRSCAKPHCRLATHHECQSRGPMSHGLAETHSKNQSWSVMLWFCRLIGKRPSRSQRQAIVIFCSASSAQSKMWWPASSCRAVWCSTRLESDLDALRTKFHLRNKLKQADPKLNPSMQAKNAIRLIIESFSSTSPSG